MKVSWTESKTIPFFYSPKADRVLSPVDPEEVEDMKYYGQTKVRVRASLSGRNGEVVIENDLLLIPVQSYAPDRPARPARTSGRTVLYPERNGRVDENLPIVVLSMDGTLDFEVEFHPPLSHRIAGSGYREIVEGGRIPPVRKEASLSLFRLDSGVMRKCSFKFTIRADRWMPGMCDVRKILPQSVVSDSAPGEMPDIEISGVPSELSGELLRELGLISAYIGYDEEDVGVFERFHGFYELVKLDIPGTKGRKWCRIDTAVGPVFYGGSRSGRTCEVLYVSDGRVFRKTEDLDMIVLAGSEYNPVLRSSSAGVKVQKEIGA